MTRAVGLSTNLRPQVLPQEQLFGGISRAQLAAPHLRQLWRRAMSFNATVTVRLRLSTCSKKDC
jgi:hypothetical protein